MNRFFNMDDKLFDTWTYCLLDEAFDWREIGISNDYCNNISIPKYGLKLHSWPEHAFEIVDEKKYTVFLLRYQ